MKNFITFIAFLLIFTSNVFADNEPESTVSSSDGTTILYPPKNRNDKPKMPSRQFITCYYDGENLNLDFAYSEGECEVCVTDITTNFSRFYYIDSSELLSTIYVGEINSSIITVTTSHGHIYTGELYLE